MAKRKKIPLAQIIRENIRAIRAKKGLTQSQLADRIGCSQAHVAAIERGNTGIGLVTIESFSDALGVSRVDLVQ